MKAIVMGLICMLGAASLASADTAPAAPSGSPAGAGGTTGFAMEAKIPFASRGGINNWQVVNDRTVLIQAQNRKWYKATLLSSCTGLSFSERVGFESNPDGSFDKFSSVRVRNRKCPLISLVETAAPEKKSKAKAMGDAAVAP